ncbi:MAG: hypothetical protein CBC13_09780 [Planctomycetia bacterium TMED53]|nr:MAG: hypothetical protein CBC13_09780 [Planctomycetia bacterium TMED53]
MSANENRIHKPTPRHLRQAAEAGIFPFSQDLAVASTIVVGGLILAWYSDTLLLEMIAAFKSFYSVGLKDPATGNQLLLEVPWLIAKLVAPVCLTIFFTAVAISWLQSPKVLRQEWIATSVSNWKPGQKLFDLFSPMTPGRLLFQLCRIGVISGLALLGYQKIVEQISASAISPTRVPFGDYFVPVSTTLVQISFALILFAVVDKVYRHWQWRNSMQMTPEELRREQREVQGDPRIRKRRKSAHLQLIKNTSATPPAAKEILDGSSQ